MRKTGTYRAALRAARATARLAPEFHPKIAAIVRDNLRLAFGHADPALVRAVFRHFAQAAVDLIFFRRLYDPARRDEHFRWEGDGIEHCRKHGGNGAIVVTGHLGNWELFSAALCHADLRVAVVAREPDTGWAARWIGGFRAEYASSVIAKKDAARGILRALRGDARVCMLVDQAAGRHGIQAPFFGRSVSTFATPATLAHRLGVPVYAGHTMRLADGIAYRCVLEHVELKPDIEAATTQLNGIIEGYVRAAPEQWWWLHRRFKQRRSERSRSQLSPAGVPLLS